MTFYGHRAADQTAKNVFGALLLSLATSTIALAHPPDWLEEEEEQYLDPPAALPQQVNGVIRRTEPIIEVGSITRIRDVFPAVRACWRAPETAAGAHGQQMTVRVSFKSNGQVLGRPRTTYAQGGDAEARRRFAESVVAAFDRCTPLPFSKGFGAAIAGRPFTFRFIDDRHT